MASLDKLAGRQILFLNWRDLCNPAAGGAEIYAEKIAALFAKTGAHVTLFTSEFDDAPPFDWANGYLIIRKGGRLGVYLAAARHMRQYGHHYHCVVDFQNGIPFFAPLWTPPHAAIIYVMHHVHQKQFDTYFTWPLNRFARFLERTATRYVYKDCPLIAVSPSTRAEMRHQLGFHRTVHIVPNGIDALPVSCADRSPTPSIAVVSRLVIHKRLELLVDAIPHLLPRWPDLQVDIAGIGPARNTLLSHVRQNGLEDVVRLPGYVSEQAKRELLSRAWLTVAPSQAEGWGLTVLEANMMGTPAVAFDVPGLRDSVRHGTTGWLVPGGESLAATLARALSHLSAPTQQRRMAEQARRWALNFSWDASAERLASVMLSEIARRAQGSPSRRQPVALATIAWWSRSEADEVRPFLSKALRITDIITEDSRGLRVLMTGCDELGAAKALERIPVPPPAGLRLATTSEVMCGTSEDNFS